jgi:hypothetical protein
MPARHWRLALGCLAERETAPSASRERGARSGRERAAAWRGILTRLKDRTRAPRAYGKG